MTVGADLKPAPRCDRLDTLAHPGSMSALIDGHGNRNEADAMSCENPQIVRIDFRAGVVRAEEERPVPEVDRKMLGMGQGGLAGDLADREVVLVDRLARQVEHISKPGG